MPGHIDNKGPALYYLLIYEPPEAGIVALIPVVSQDKYRTLGHLNRAKVLPGLGTSIFVDSVIFRERALINVNGLSRYPDGIPFDGDYPLDKDFAGIHGINENDYISCFWLGKGENFYVSERNLNTVNKLVNQNVIP